MQPNNINQATETSCENLRASENLIQSLSNKLIFVLNRGSIGNLAKLIATQNLVLHNE